MATFQHITHWNVVKKFFAGTVFDFFLALAWKYGCGLLFFDFREKKEAQPPPTPEGKEF